MRTNGPENTGGDRDWDAEWSSLTAGLDGPAAPPPSASEIAPEPDVLGQPEPPAQDERPRYRIGDTPRIGGGTGPRDYAPPEDLPPELDLDHWSPPAVPPAPTSRLTWLAWAGIGGGPLLLVLALIAFDHIPIWFIALCLAAFVAGCALGFARLPQRHRDSSDDGAQV